MFSLHCQHSSPVEDFPDFAFSSPEAKRSEIDAPNM